MPFSDYSTLIEITGIVLGTVLFVVLAIIVPVNLYIIRKFTFRALKELEQQTYLLNRQKETLDALETWMRYFNDKVVKRLNVPPPDERPVEKETRPPVTPYKKSL